MPRLSNSGLSAGAGAVDDTTLRVSLATGGDTEALVLASGTESGNLTIPAGAVSIGLKFNTDFTGTVDGEAFVAADVAFSLSAPPGYTLPAVAVVRSAGTWSWFTLTPP